MRKENKLQSKSTKNKKKLKTSSRTNSKSGFGIILKEFLKNNYIYIIMIVLVILRIALGYGMGAWYGISETYDDVAMMQGLSLKRLIEPTNLALIKDLSFSLFLGFSAITNLPYTVVLSAFWALTAFVVWLLVRKVTDKKWVQLLAFFYVLFLPIAFSSWGGLRVYRNAIIAPSVILTFSLALMVLLALVRGEKNKKTVWTAIFAGISFAFTYFLKEDGLWLKACMLVLLLVCLTIIGYRLFKKRAKGRFEVKKAISWLIICLIPFGVLFLWDNVYRGVNYAFFGVYEINTRTEGELGEFVENIYKIDSPNRSEEVWAPYDAIEKAFEASPTLASHPKLLDEIMNTGWNEGGIKVNPIKYDFLGWVMRSELADAGLWTSEKDVNEMFKRVNDELNEAFKNGSLKKAEGRIQLLASTGGYTWDEIMRSNLLEQVRMSFEDANWYNNYLIGFGDVELAYGTKGLEWDYSKANRVLHMDGDVNVIGDRNFAINTVYIIMWAYRILNTIFLCLLVVLPVWQLVMLIRAKDKKKYIRDNATVISLIIMGLMFLGVTLVYSFATAWFFIAPLEGAAYYTRTFVFYRVGVPALLTMAYMPILIAFSMVVRKLKKK